jgi:hypothetical protein
MAAWAHGSGDPAGTLPLCLALECRQKAQNDRARELIDGCLDMVDRTHPDEARGL